jgi:cell division inhibitor SepF
MWRRAMVYLGLQDDDEFAYDAEYDEYDYDDEDTGHAPARERAHARVQRDTSDVQPLHEDLLHEPVEPPPKPRTESGLVRPLPRDESSSLVTPRPAVVRQQQSSSPVHVVEPSGFNDAQELGDRLKSNQAVVLNLRGLDRDLQRRLIDFSSGLAYAVGGTMRKVDDQVFLLTPTSVEVSEEDKERLQARGLYRA